jgi:tetratricopeptide (TPR) repeat protein
VANVRGQTGGRRPHSASLERLRARKQTLIDAFHDAFVGYTTAQLELHFTELNLLESPSALREAPFLKRYREFARRVEAWAKDEGLHLEHPDGGREGQEVVLKSDSGEAEISGDDVVFFLTGVCTMIRMIGKQPPKLIISTAQAEALPRKGGGAPHPRFVLLSKVIHFCRAQHATVLKLPELRPLGSSDASAASGQVGFVTKSDRGVHHLFFQHPAGKEERRAAYLDKYRLLGSINDQASAADYSLEEEDGLWVMSSKTIKGDTVDAYLHNVWRGVNGDDSEKNISKMENCFRSICNLFLREQHAAYGLWKHPISPGFQRPGWGSILPRLFDPAQGVHHLFRTDALPQHMLYGGVSRTGEAPFFIVHGDEWGKNILYSSSAAYLVDFEDGLIAMYDDHGAYTRRDQVGNPHWRRIYGEDVGPDLGIEAFPLEGLNVVSSLARMFAALLQRATMLDGKVDGLEERMLVFLDVAFNEVEAALRRCSPITTTKHHAELDDHERASLMAFFRLAFLDWLLHWRNKPRKDGEGVYLTVAVFNICLEHITRDDGDDGDNDVDQDGRSGDDDVDGGERELGHSIRGNQNIQISAGRDVKVEFKGVPSEQHAETLAENKALSDRVAELMALIAQMEIEQDEATKDALAKRATNEADALTRQERVEFTPDEMLKVALANQLAGRLDVAEGHLKQALRSFRSESDLRGEADSLNILGVIAQTRGDLAEAERLFRESLAIKREMGDRQGEAYSLGNLGNIAQTRGDLAEAERLHRESLAIEREICNRQGEANSLNNLGNIAITRGDLAEAERLFRESLAIKREIGDRQGEAYSLGNLGSIAQTRGDLAEAERFCRESLAIIRDIGDRNSEADSLNNLGNIAYARGDLAEAERLHRESLAIKREIGNRQGEAASLNNLGSIAQTRGDLAEAERFCRESLAIMREIGDRQGEAGSLGNLGNIARNRGDLAEAERLLLEAKSVYQEIGDRAGVSRQLNNLGKIAHKRGDLAEAERLYRESLAIIRDIGDRYGEAVSIGSLSVIMKERGHGHEAFSLRDQALALWDELGHPVPAWFSNAWP